MGGDNLAFSANTFLSLVKTTYLSVQYWDRILRQHRSSRLSSLSSLWVLLWNLNSAHWSWHYLAVGLRKQPLKLGYEWVITSHRKLWMVIPNQWCWYGDCGAPFQYKDRLSRYGITIVKTTVLSYGNSFIDKTASVHWDGLKVICQYFAINSIMSMVSVACT